MNTYKIKKCSRVNNKNNHNYDNIFKIINNNFFYKQINFEILKIKIIKIKKPPTAFVRNPVFSNNFFEENIELRKLLNLSDKR